MKADKLSEARLRYLIDNAYGDGVMDCRSAGGNRAALIQCRLTDTQTRPAYNPWRSRGYPDHAKEIDAAYEKGWIDEERAADLKRISGSDNRCE